MAFLFLLSLLFNIQLSVIHFTLHNAITIRIISIKSHRFEQLVQHTPNIGVCHWANSQNAVSLSCCIFRNYTVCKSNILDILHPAEIIKGYSVQLPL